MSIKIVYNGKVYLSKKALCDDNNVSLTTFMKRLERGWSVDEAIKGKRKKCCYKNKDGIEFYSYLSFCAYYNITLATCLRKLKQGYTMDEIAHKIIKRTRDHKGNAYSSEKEMCDFYRIKVSTFRARRYAGWSLEDALTKPLVK